MVGDFIDLRDRTGILQVVLNPEISEDAHNIGEAVRSEFVIAAKGKVSRRPEGTINEKLPSGEIEILVTELKILNNAKTPPFMIEETTNVSEDVRLNTGTLICEDPTCKKHHYEA